MADEKNTLNDDDIERLLQQSSAGDAPPPEEPEQSASAGAASDGSLNQDDIDQLLGQTAAGSAPEPKKPAVRQAAPEGVVGGGGGSVPQGDVEYLLNQAQRALESIDSGPDASPPPGLASFRFEEFAGEPASAENTTLDLISDVQLDLKIELGRTHMYLEDVLRLSRGSVVSLDKLAGDPVDIYVNERLIARGEVLVLNDNFCVRVGELIVGANSDG